MADLDMASALLVVAGAINWGLVGAFGVNALELVLGGVALRAAYLVIGIAGVYSVKRLWD